MNDETDKLPVFACDADEVANYQPIGLASDEKQAAKIMRKFFSERDGDDYGITAQHVYYSKVAGGFCVDQ